MDVTIAKEIVSFGQDAGYDMDVVPEYSGRGMFGEKTVGVRVDDIREFTTACLNYAMDMRNDRYGHRRLALDLMMDNLKMDSLGKQWICY